MFLKSLFWQIVNSLIKIFLEVFVFDRKIRRILKGNWAKCYLKKYIQKGCTNPTHQSPVLTDSHSTGTADTYTLGSSIVPSRGEDVPIIWQYWESPDGSAPPIVQACMNSVKKFRGKCKRIFLNYENIKDYIELPDIIYKMKKNNKMCTAHFVDIVRTALLVKYGGVWVDSTILFTDTIPEYIIDSELFFYRTEEKGDLDGLCGTNYLISASKPNNKILSEVLNSMYAYWKENRFLINYFSHMHIITLVCKKYPELLNAIPFYSFYPVQELQWELLNSYNEKRWKQLKQMTTIHKLTHKQKVLTKKKEIDTTGTFYEHVIKEYINEV